ncbi:MAG TPA: FecR domain-containing protein [Polyangiaceae bacterium]|jgi:ferric-dicitrate binding protein FerR (iron transport regulator)|nr:FecR domain-containing protein [Polyangiaceae bacterium]
MTTGDDETTLRAYIEALPAGHRVVRDRGTRRKRLVSSLTVHAERERKRMRRRRAATRVAAVVLLCGASLGAVWALVPARRAVAVAAAPMVTVVSGAVRLDPGDTPRTLHAGESVGLADVVALEAPPGDDVHVRVSDIVNVTLTPSTRVRPLRTTKTGGTELIEAVGLERGRAHFDVKKLGDTRRFHVLTPDTDVEVRGTSFDVELRPGRTPGTCVSVESGLVWIASGLDTRLLSRGESWGCDDRDEGREASAPSSPPSDKAPPQNGDTSPGPAAGVNGGRSRDVERADPTDLRVQNELFQSALAAERAGRTEDAARSYRKLLARAPHGTLAAQARANLRVMASPR